MVSHSNDPSGRSGAGQATSRGERAAKVLARAGVASRREVELLIEAGRVALNGQVLTSPAVNVGQGDILTLDGLPVAEREPARLWRYHKPAGLITTHKDPKGRQSVFDRLPPGMPRVISVGRLDLTSEGLLLLTNDGDLAREFELPTSGLVRRYRARAFGRATQESLDRLKDGIVVDGIAYGPIQAHLDGGRGSNIWISLALAEGKNREVRKVLEAVGLKVNRLIRTAYGPFELGTLEQGAVEEIPAKRLRQLLKDGMPTQPENPRPLATPRSDMPRPRPTKGAKPPGGRIRKTRTPTSRSERAAKDAAEKAPITYKAGWARPKPRIKSGAKPGAKPGRTSGAKPGARAGQRKPGPKRPSR